MNYEVRAKTAFGYSVYSPISSFVVASTPTMLAPTLVSSTKTTITVTWAVSSNGGSSITGYILSQADSVNGVYSVVYNGTGLSSINIYTSSVVTGHKYKYQVIGINAAGNGTSSPESSYFLAATVPGAPSPPLYNSSNSTSIVLQIGANNVDDGGSPITRNDIYIAPTGQSTLTVIPQYNGLDSQFNVAIGVVSGLVSGTIYQFATTSTNGVGTSLMSGIVSIGLGSLPQQMTAPTVNYTLSTGTSLNIYWAAGSSSPLPIIGYQLYMRTQGTTPVLQYDSSLNPNALSTVVTGLTLGTQYMFSCLAMNINGAGPLSTELSAYACTAPTILNAPTLQNSTTTSLYLQWSSPINIGNCPLIQYQLFSDSGTGGALSTQIDPTTFASNPSLTSYNVTGLSGTGTTFRFQLLAINAVGSASSIIVGFILASAPLKPPVLVYDSVYSTATAIKLNFPTIPTASNGGSAITGVILQSAITGASTYVTLLNLTTGTVASYIDTSASLIVGMSYRYHYQVANINGWSPFSDDLIVIAASAPGKPPLPSITALTPSTIYLLLASPSNVGGTPVTEVDLEMGTNTTNPTFAVIQTGFPDITYQVVAANGITPGQVYAFRYRAKNSAGFGPYSDTLVAGCGTTPSQPVSVFSTDITKCSANSIYLSWSTDIPATGELPILGYIIQSKLSGSSDSTYITSYNGATNPSQLFTTITGLISGQAYVFRIYAVNINGNSSSSSTLTVYACGLPSAPAAPTFLSTNVTGCTIAWQQPSSTGGCPLTGFDVMLFNSTSSTFTKVNTGFDSDPTLQQFLCGTGCLPTGAALGATYIFEVRAKNSAPGIGPNSTASNPILYADVPGTPSNAPANDPTGTSGSQIRVIYAAVTTINGSPITSYEVQMTLSSSAQSYQTIQNSISLIAIANTGIVGGSSYLFRYRAWNSIGAGQFSPSVSIVAAAIPSKMSSPTVTLTGANIRFAWVAPNSNGLPITSYSLQIFNKQSLIFQESPCNGGSSTVIANQYCDVSPTVLQTTYGYNVFDIPSAKSCAANSIGSGPYSDPSTSGSIIPQLPGQPPSPPTVVSGVTYGTTIQIAIAALTGNSYTGGATISSYNIQWDQGTSTWTDLTYSLVLSATVNGLTLGTSYSFRYRAANVIGNGTYSSTLTVKAVSVPSQIATPNAIYTGTNNAYVKLSWATPASNGGTIDAYKVITFDVGNSIEMTNAFCQEGVLPTTSCTVPMSSFWSTPFNLTTAGVPLIQEVQAHNEAGWGILSSQATGGVTVQTVPIKPPVIPWLNTGSTTSSQLVVVWSALGTGQNGGSAILSYSLLWDAGSGNTPSTVIYSGTATTTTITTGLQPGTTYQFEYAGVNVFGIGNYSGIASLRLPATNPTAPAPPATTNSGSTVQISWNLPSYNGGSAIVNYNIYVRDQTDLTYKQNPTFCVNPGTSLSCSFDYLSLMNYYHLSTGSQILAEVAAINADGLVSPLSSPTTSPATC